MTFPGELDAFFLEDGIGDWSEIRLRAIDIQVIAYQEHRLVLLENDIDWVDELEVVAYTLGSSHTILTPFLRHKDPEGFVDR